MKRVLVTGATGFIGRHTLKPLLDKGYEVHIASRSHTTSNREVMSHRVNLLNPTDVSRLLHDLKPTHLLHLAWYVEHGKFWSSPENFHWVTASLHLLQAFAANGGQRVVMAGTCAEYDWDHGVCDEESTLLQPTTLYATSKHALHLMLDSYAAQMGLSAGWGRVFFLYGPHEYPSRLVASVARSLLMGVPVQVSHGEQVRDFLCVVDVADAFVALLDCDVQGAVNIASGQPVRIESLISIIAQQAGNHELIEWGALATRPDDPPHIVARVNRLHNLVGWSPFYDLKHGIKITLDWWKQHLNDTNSTMPSM